MPALGWERAYRSGDLVVFDAAGLVFQGRADDQVKVGGRRIELGEIESALQALPGVTGAAAAVRRTEAGNQVLVGYLAATGELRPRRSSGEARPRSFPPHSCRSWRWSMSSRRAPRARSTVPRCPGRSPGVEPDAAGLGASAAWLAEQWQSVLGVPVADPDASFFDLGGGSLAAAQLVSRIRARDPEFTVADIYDHPRLGAMAEEIDLARPSMARVPEPATVPTHDLPAAGADAARHAVDPDTGRACPVHPGRCSLAALPPHRDARS